MPPTRRPAPEVDALARGSTPAPPGRLQSNRDDDRCVDAAPDAAVPAQRHVGLAATLDRRVDPGHRHPDRGDHRGDGRRRRRIRPAQRVARPQRPGPGLQRRGRGMDAAAPGPVRRPGDGRPGPSDGGGPRAAAPGRTRGSSACGWCRGCGTRRPPTAATTRCSPTACEAGVPFCTQVGHTGPLRPSETGRPIPYIDQVALDFPELVIVCGHVGYPWTEEMVAVARKHENVYIDTSAYTIRRLPEELIRFMKTGTGQRKVLFGTNYPMIAPCARPGRPRRTRAHRRGSPRLPARQRRARLQTGGLDKVQT